MPGVGGGAVGAVGAVDGLCDAALLSLGTGYGLPGLPRMENSTTAEISANTAAGVAANTAVSCHQVIRVLPRAVTLRRAIVHSGDVGASGIVTAAGTSRR